MNHMKITKYTLFIITILFLLTALESCMDADINRNKYEVTQKQLGQDNYDLGSVIRGMQGLVIPTQEHLYQFMEAMCGGSYSGYFGDTRTAWLEKYSTYNPKVDWLKAPFCDVISDTYPFYFQILKKEESPIAQSLAKLLRVAIMHRITDVYGPIPYSKVIKDGSALETDGLSSAYDSQKEVYIQMFKELEEADQVLADNMVEGESGFEKLDDVYFGNLKQWRLFLHSLQLRLAMRLTYTDMASEAQTIAENAVAAGVIEKNADNAMFHVAENRSALCFNDWNDYRAGADIVSYMNGYDDPRRAAYFTKIKSGDTESYFGIRIGINSVFSDEMLIKSYSNRLMTAADPYVWMTAAEVAFLRAEGALRKWNMGGDAKAFYETGIKLSCEEHGVSASSEYLKSTTTPAAYKDNLGPYTESAPVSTICVQWNPDTSDKAFEENLERIITQKWIALYPNGIEAWSERRRTGYPKLLPVKVNNGRNVSSDRGMRRLMYPSEEYKQNATHMPDAINLLIQESSQNRGGDTGGTQVWWDKKTTD